MKNQIFAVNKSKLQDYSKQFKNKYNNLYCDHYFKNLKPEGRTDIYHSIKKIYRCEDYINIISDFKLRNNITRITTSSHCLPIEKLRRKGIERSKRICTLCNNEEIGSELHILCNCTNSNLVHMRKHLHDKLIKINHSWTKFKFSNIITILLLATENETSLFYFSMFLIEKFVTKKN